MTEPSKPACSAKPSCRIFTADERKLAQPALRILAAQFN